MPSANYNVVVWELVCMLSPEYDSGTLLLIETCYHLKLSKKFT